jgi:hypothetical protein
MHPALDEALAVESTWKKNATPAKEEGDRSSSDGCDSLADMLVVWFCLVLPLGGQLQGSCACAFAVVVPILPLLPRHEQFAILHLIALRACEGHSFEM